MNVTGVSGVGLMISSSVFPEKYIQLLYNVV